MIREHLELTKALTEPSQLSDRYISAEYSTRSWPLTQPEYIFVLDAVLRVGSAQFGEDWTGSELDALIWDTDPITVYREHWGKALRNARVMKKPPRIPMSLSGANRHPDRDQTEEEFEDHKRKCIAQFEENLASTPDYLNAKQERWAANDKAKGRLFHAIRWLGNKCRAGAIEGSFQYLGAQKMHPMTVDLWNGKSDLDRWAKNGGYFTYENQIKYRTQLFVRLDQLEHEIANLAHAPFAVSNSDLSKLSPDLQLAVRVALDLELFTPDAKADGEVQTAIIKAAKNAGRTIVPTKAKQMSATIRWPNRLFDEKVISSKK